MYIICDTRWLHPPNNTMIAVGDAASYITWSEMISAILLILLQ